MLYWDILKVIHRCPLATKKRSQLPEGVYVLQSSEVNLKQFNACLLLADEILQEMRELSSHRFTGIGEFKKEYLQQFPLTRTR